MIIDQRNDATSTALVKQTHCDIVTGWIECCLFIPRLVLDMATLCYTKFETPSVVEHTHEPVLTHLVRQPSFRCTRVNHMSPSLFLSASLYFSERGAS